MLNNNYLTHMMLLLLLIKTSFIEGKPDIAQIYIYCYLAFPFIYAALWLLEDYVKSKKKNAPNE